MELVLAAIRALDDSIVGSIIGLIIASIVASILGELLLFLLFPLLVVDDRSAVAGTMIYMPLISFPARQYEDGEVIEYFPFQNIVECPPKSN